jgi:FkbM family methyltransferase
MLIPFEEVIKEANVPIKGIIHIGAHHCEELEKYVNAGIHHIIWIEANPNLMQVIENRIKDYPKQIAFNYAIVNNRVKSVELNIGQNDQTSSILEFEKVQKLHPQDAILTQKVTVPCTRLKSLFEAYNLDPNNYNVINVDIQGAELEAIQSFGSYLKYIDVIYTEVNIIDLYNGVSLMSTFDWALGNNGFTRSKTKITRWMWGDAIYFRGKNGYLVKYIQAKYLELVAKLKYWRRFE